MVSLTLAVSQHLKQKMAEHPEIKWSEVVRAVLEQQVEEVEEAERIASKSRLTEKDVEDLASAVDEGIAKRWKHATHG